MFGRKNNGASTAETVTRSVVAAGRIVAGERGARVANAITGPVTGRIEICDDPTCKDCAPVR
ncbi:hypothetical protein [Streptomyces niveus]|uniref:hypothetical protein n=1 Tax=Streptomyces niveus TaxID=193462 RepID=UPI0003C5B81B|nr:hypothetical protein [Streptomyces niveus]EST17898.1 hypothetical protein M877_40020 [Streptomyces niveus NCIMB 11891]